jgi:hypothetical protein
MVAPKGMNRRYGEFIIRLSLSLGIYRSQVRHYTKQRASLLGEALHNGRREGSIPFQAQFSSASFTFCMNRSATAPSRVR